MQHTIEHLRTDVPKGLCCCDPGLPFSLASTDKLAQTKLREREMRDAAKADAQAKRLAKDQVRLGCGMRVSIQWRPIYPAGLYPLGAGHWLGLSRLMPSSLHIPMLPGAHLPPSPGQGGAPHPRHQACRQGSPRGELGVGLSPSHVVALGTQQQDPLTSVTGFPCADGPPRRPRPDRALLRTWHLALQGDGAGQNGGRWPRRG